MGRSELVDRVVSWDGMGWQGVSERERERELE